MKKLVPVVLAVAGLFSVSGTASAMIINGGFEDPDVASGSFGIFDSISGWTASSGKIEIQDNAAGSPYEGDQFLELDSTRPSTVYQDVGGLLAGQQYLLSFAFSARANTSIPLDNVLSVTWDGLEIFKDQALTYNPVWTVYSFTVTASGASNRLQFADVSQNALNSLGVYIDDVQLSAVPEPFTLALFGAGLLGMGFIRRRRTA